LVSDEGLPGDATWSGQNIAATASMIATATPTANIQILENPFMSRDLCKPDTKFEKLMI